jgi:hypothetical protein
MDLGGDLQLTRDPYIHRLNDEHCPLPMNIRVFFTTACFGCLSGWGASKTGKLYRNYTTPISHTSSNPQFTIRKCKTSLRTLRQYSSRQAKPKPKLWQEKAKNDYRVASLLPDPPTGLRRASTKSYPCPPPCCDPEPP